MTSFENPSPSRRGDDPESTSRRAGTPGSHPYEQPSEDPTTKPVSGRASDAPTVPVREVRSTGTPRAASAAEQQRAEEAAELRAKAAADREARARAAPAAGPERTAHSAQEPVYEGRSTVPPRETRYAGTARTTGKAAAAPPRKRRLGWLLPAALAALAAIFMGLYASKGDSSDWAKSSVKVDEKLPYPTEIRHTVNAAKVNAREARTAALKRHDGTMVSESLESDMGYARWNVDILGDDGKLHSVVVDPGNAKILRDTVNTQVNMTDLRNAAASRTGAAAVSDRISDAGRTPSQIVYDAGAKQWAATSWSGGNSIQQNYSAATGRLVPQASAR
ncbi:hypothetical protein SRB5_21880 [Streptomyces sp. RB5]|uniref:PepSY domain-containing protein n=1 Tax=Streptomyces smaragdinus TaxID=2585196 RepID=A0A7K0CF10_9ACTN|nr:PepSY domain-containing protein [Streptomyces smaragdinus]MQY12059.1 hypothetical protein [Streptomyces smaragdinus]